MGVKDSHFTITPNTDATGKLQFVVVIFAAKEVLLEWSLGIDIFAEWDTEEELNIGPGMRHPGLLLVSSDGKDIPVLFAANTKVSMTAGILKKTFQKMDELGITQRGVDENGSGLTRTPESSSSWCTSRCRLPPTPAIWPCPSMPGWTRHRCHHRCRRCRRRHRHRHRHPCFHSRATTLPPGRTAPCTPPRGPARTKPATARSRRCMTFDGP